MIFLDMIMEDSSSMRPILIGLAVIVFLSVLIGTDNFRFRRPRRPPLVPYTVPWVGSAISMGGNTDAFFQSCLYVISSPSSVDSKANYSFAGLGTALFFACIF